MLLKWYWIFFRKIRIIFYKENWLWESEISTFLSLNFKHTLIYQRSLKMKKCYIFTTQFWCGSCWKILKMYLFQSSQCRGCRLFRRLAFHTIEYDYFPWTYAIHFISALIWRFFFTFRALNTEVVACSINSHFTQLNMTIFR